MNTHPYSQTVRYIPALDVMREQVITPEWTPRWNNKNKKKNKTKQKKKKKKLIDKKEKKL